MKGLWKENQLNLLRKRLNRSTFRKLLYFLKTYNFSLRNSPLVNSDNRLVLFLGKILGGK